MNVAVISAEAYLSVADRLRWSLESCSTPRESRRGAALSRSSPRVGQNQPVTSSYRPARRRRARRRNLWLIVIALVAVGVVYGVVRAQGESQLTREYLDVAFDVASGQSATAIRFNDLVVELEGLDRTIMLDRLATMESELVALTLDLDRAEPPDGLMRGHLFLQIAATNWRNGMTTFTEGMTALSDSPLDESALAVLTDGMIEMRVGDTAYLGFLSEMLDVDTSLQGGPFPSVLFVASGDVFDARDIARRLFVTPGLVTATNFAIADLKLEPGPVGESEGIPVVPVAGSYSAEVTVSNRGNEAGSDLVVVVDLVSNDGDLYEARQSIEALEPGALITVVFGDLPVAPGVTYEVIATLEKADDDASDDEQRFLFSVNPEA